MNSLRFIAPGARLVKYVPDVVRYALAADTDRWVTTTVVRGAAVRGFPALRSRRGSALVASLLMVLVVGGCGQSVQRVAVSGQVLLDGQPLTVGTIRFVPTSGRPASSRIMADGSFRIAMKSLAAGGDEVVGLFPGSYRIAISATEDLGEAEDDEVRWLVPRHYGNFRTSGLEADIQGPTESLVVELTWAGAEDTDEKTGPESSSVLEEDRATIAQQKDET